MKYTKLALLAVVFSFGASNFAGAYQNCDAKKQALEYQVKQAEKYGNYNKVTSLKRALEKVDTYCVNNNEVNAKKEIGNLENKIKSLKSDIKDLQIDMKEAKRKNDIKKVNKIKSKIEDKKSDIFSLKEKIKHMK